MFREQMETFLGERNAFLRERKRVNASLLWENEKVSPLNANILKSKLSFQLIILFHHRAPLVTHLCLH